MEKNSYAAMAKIIRYPTPNLEYMIEIVKDQDELESWLVLRNYSIKLFCYGIPRNSENKGQTMELLEMTLNELELFKAEYETIRERIEEENQI